MATAKKLTKVTTARKTVKPAAPAKKSAATPEAAAKPNKAKFNKTTLVAHLAVQAGVEPKAAKAVLTALEATVLASVHKKGIGEFTFPGLMKISALSVAAKKKRFGKDPFTGAERWFAPKPASVKIKVRALKKLKDAAL